MEINPTIIIRHKKENLKKCSLKGLESRKDMIFYTYPNLVLPDLSVYILLTLDGENLKEEDKDYGLVLIDSTWRYLEKILKMFPENIKTRSLPKKYKTAYPRKQTACKDPQAGLASIEALYLAYLITKKDTKGLLDNYHWKDAFLKINNLSKIS